LNEKLFLVVGGLNNQTSQTEIFSTSFSKEKNSVNFLNKTLPLNNGLLFKGPKRKAFFYCGGEDSSGNLTKNCFVFQNEEDRLSSVNATSFSYYRGRGKERLFYYKKNHS